MNILEVNDFFNPGLKLMSRVWEEFKPALSEET